MNEAATMIEEETSRFCESGYPPACSWDKSAKTFPDHLDNIYVSNTLPTTKKKLSGGPSSEIM